LLHLNYLDQKACYKRNVKENQWNYNTYLANEVKYKYGRCKRNTSVIFPSDDIIVQSIVNRLTMFNPNGNQETGAAINRKMGVLLKLMLVGVILLC